MNGVRNIDPSFQYHLDFKSERLSSLFISLRKFILTLCPESNELLYNTHALTTVFSLSPKLSDGFCHIPIYTDHLNLGFNKGILLEDSTQLLKGTGKLIRHIPITAPVDYDNPQVKSLILSSINFALKDMDHPQSIRSKVYSKIKK